MLGQERCPAPVVEWRAVYSEVAAVLGQTDPLDVSGWGGLKMNTLKEQDVLW